MLLQSKTTNWSPDVRTSSKEKLEKENYCFTNIYFWAPWVLVQLVVDSSTTVNSGLFRTKAGSRNFDDSASVSPILTVREVPVFQVSTSGKYQ